MDKIVVLYLAISCLFSSMFIKGSSQGIRRLPKVKEIILEEKKEGFYPSSFIKQSELNSQYLDLTGQAILDENGFCFIHHEKLVKEIIKTEYGCIVDIGDESQYYCVKKNSFPNATVRIGGCGSRSNNKRFAIVLNCNSCKQFRETWIKLNAEDDHFYN